MLMLNQSVNPGIYTPAPLVSHANTVGTGLNCNGTYLNSSDYFVYFAVRKKTLKEEILELADKEIFFDEEDNKAAMKEIKRISVEKKVNIYRYYD